jgi:hypothetical protein
MARYGKSPAGRIRQGDILRDIEYMEDAFQDEEGYLGISCLVFPYVVVMSQDCDLASDLRARNKGAPDEKCQEISTDTVVESILVCPAHDKDLFVAGEHLAEVGLHKMAAWRTTRSPWENLVKGLDPRYHYLPGSTELGTNDMIIDFKHFYTISRAKIYREYQNHYVGSIGELYREQLSQRFACFLSRIGLPDQV